MIVAYTGVPGGGKSLHAAQDCLDAICYKGIPVIANFDCNREKFDKTWFARKEKGPFFYIKNKDITPGFLIRFARWWYREHEFHESGILLVIDEAQIMFNARSWSEEGRDKWIYFMSNSRHFGYKVILITQMFEMLDKQIRGLIEIQVQHRNMSNFGLAGKLIALFCGGKLFACISVYVGLRQRIGVQFVFGRRHLYDFYDSYDTESFLLADDEPF